MQKIDFAKAIINVDDKPLTDPVFDDKGNPTGEREVVLFKTLAIRALMAKEEGLPGEKMLKRFTLAKQIQKSNVVDLTSDQVVELKKCIEKNYSIPLIYGNFYELLESPVKQD